MQRHSLINYCFPSLKVLEIPLNSERSQIPSFHTISLSFTKEGIQIIDYKADVVRAPAGHR